MADTTDSKVLSPEDRRGLMFASHLCQAMAESLSSETPGSLDDDGIALLRKFAETAHAEIEKALNPSKA
jgi:hypothetical protein